MTLLIIGTVIFFAIHLVPSLPLKQTIITAVGPQKYKLIFSACSLSGLGFIIYGFSLTSLQPLWAPLPWARSLVIYTMPVAVVMLIAADMPNNLKRLLRHPMLFGLILWSGTHLLANGDLASTIIFLSFLAFSVLDLFLIEQGGRATVAEPVSIKWDIALLIIAIAVYFLLFYFHGSFTGMPLR